MTTPSLASNVVAGLYPGMVCETLDRQQVRKGFLSIEKLTLRQHKADGTWSKPFHREVVERGDAVAVVVHDPVLDRLLFVRQMRPGSLIKGQPWLLELVAGMIDTEEVDGVMVTEDPAESARRELLEEAGLVLNDLQRVSMFYNSAGGSSETTTVYYATADLSQPAAWGGNPSENEVIQIVTMGMNEAMEGLDNGLFNSASAAVGLYWLRGERANGRDAASRYRWKRTMDQGYASMGMAPPSV